MNRSDVYAYWRDPDSDRYGAADNYRAACQPEFYIGLEKVSRMWLDVFAEFVPKEASVLELGCGTGRNLHYLRQAGYKDLCGAEISQRAVDLGRIHFGEDIANRIAVSTIEEFFNQHTFPSFSCAFDVVFTSGVLMHIHPESTWVFRDMAKTARTWLMCAEVEETVGIYKWPRQYRPIFEGFGFRQVKEMPAASMSRTTVLRVFRRVPVFV